MAESRETERNLAMLIDGDNAQYKLFRQMLEEASRYGTVTIRRAYGDWTQSNMANWRSVMLDHAILPILQLRYTTGKNATDSALIIDAMDILYSGTVQGFCIVSSDSDFTRLCTRIRESGLFVMGIGREQTPKSFIQACNVFIYVENMIGNSELSESMGHYAEIAEESVPEDSENLESLLQRAFDISAGEDGWAHLGTFGSALKRLDPSFDSRTYGYKNLSLLVKSLSYLFDIQGENQNGPSSIYVRMK